MKLNKQAIENYIERGYLLSNKHPDYPLYILNYSRLAQFEKLWDEYTLLCRGLIIDENYNVVGRCFPKFFNIEEHAPEEIPNLPFEIFDKMDGSLGLLFYYDNSWHLATRGSFVSDQAIKGKEILNKYDLSYLNKENTYLFEIIYPENRIVCNYDQDEKLVLLAVINNDTGHELSYDIIKTRYSAFFEIVKKYEDLGDLDFNQLKGLNAENKEGFILIFSNGMRVKVKFEDYIRLHRIITNVSTKDVWEHLKDKKDLIELLDRVPDEFDAWVRKQIFLLKKEYVAVEAEAYRICSNIYEELYLTKPKFTKKDFAEYVIKYSRGYYPAILFKINNNKDYSDVIWKAIKPKWSKPFFKMNDEEVE